VAVVGAGRVGTAIAVLLGRAGHEIVAVSGREASERRASVHLPGVPLVAAADAVREADLAVVSVPDDLLAELVGTVAAAIRPGTWVAHVSGAAGLEVLAPVGEHGGRRLAIHPLQTFPDVERAIASIPGSLLAVTADDEEGWDLGERLGRDLGARPFRLADEHRPLYHAAAVFASNYLVAVSALAAELFEAAGVPDPVEAMRPLQEASLANVALLGPAAALTGPAVRGDAGTIGSNLEALATSAPGAVEAYVTLCRVALELATGLGRLADEDRAAVEEVLARWS
jgi:predicted short-subunit dehydrogenase-like oxidoreductase (DUF2520 family)